MTKPLKQVSKRVAWFPLCAILFGSLAQDGRAQNSVFPPPAPGATSCTAAGANWLTCTISGSTLTLGAATGQSSHQVIGTCGSATSFGPCALVVGDIPSLSSVYLPLAGGTLTGSLLFTDASYDIGASGATRPRNLFLSGNGTVGGTLTVGNRLLTNAEYSNGTCTTSATIAPANGNRQSITLTAGDACALTFTQPSSGTMSIQLKIIQSASGSFNGTISGGKWPGGTAPTITATTGAVDIATCYLDGTNAYCVVTQNFQ